MSLPLASLPPVILRQPTEIHFGTGTAESALKLIAATHPRRVLVVTSPSVRALAERCADLFRQQGAAIEIIADVAPEPKTSRFEAQRQLAHAFAPDLVCAIGGGSVLDIGKLLAALHDRTEPVASFYGIGVLAGRCSRLVCLPTTAGTGSEVSPNALLYDDAASAKKAVISPALVPDVAIVDSVLTHSLPPALTATTGIDALCHCLEGFANRAAHPIVDRYAAEGVRLIGTHLTRAVAKGDDAEARAAVALGSLYGGLCLGPVNTAAVHALAYPLSGEFHLAHGLSIALLLAPVVRFSLPAATERYAELARLLRPEATADALPDLLQKLVADCGVPLGLRHHGIPREAIPRLADGALTVTRLLKNNPRPVTRADAIAIYEAAY